ncbi:hypothetical protein BGZ47_001603 [Haplosporangium gracile]|nr:hypothetical protein BGZ47_001602 [Haplosporangium gracile]KAF8948888.1 hypothetical protein BGZ47_001603 [Haplosporangium gracile]
MQLEEPSLVESGTLWGSALTFEGVEIGWYWIVVCVSLKNLDYSKVFTMNFDVQRKSTGQDEWLMTDNSCETTLRTEELSAISKDDYVRLRIHRQLYIDDIDDSCRLGINLTNTDDNDNAGSVEVHYIELGASAFDSPSGVKDHVIYGDGVPDYFISVGADEPSRTKAVTIFAYEISDTKNHAATLHFTPGEGHINLWDLRAPENYVAGNKKSRPITRPIGRVSFRVSPFLTAPESLKEYSPIIAISSTGSQIVVGSERETAHGIPFQVFKMPPSKEILDKANIYPPATLTRVPSICSDLASYYGIGVFHRIDPTNTNEKDERFIIYNGITLEMYDTESWCRIYRLELGYQRGEEFTLCITQSLRGRYFCWNGFKGVISIWDIETGRIASNIYVEEDRAATYAVLSPDESKVAISVKGTIQIFDTVTGIKMGSYFEGVDRDNMFGIIFEQDHFLTTNRTLSNTNDVFMPNMRSVVRVRDMVVVEDYYIHEDYAVQQPQTGNVPFFTNRQGSVANFLSLGNILYPPSEEYSCGITNDCPLLDRPFDIFYVDSVRTFVNSEEITFTAYSSQKYVAGEVTHTLQVGIGASYEEMTNTMTLILGKSLEHRIFWVRETSQLFIVNEGFLFTWTLSNAFTNVATLDRVVKFLDYDPDHAKHQCITDILNVKMCEHACQYTVEIKPTYWIVNNGSSTVRPPAGTPNSTLTFPKSAADTFHTTQDYRNDMGILGLIQLYQFGDSDFKDEIIRFLKNRIRPSRENPLSCLVTLCRAWNADDRFALEQIVTKLLPPKYITWIPDPHEDKSTEPLAILLEIAQTRPRVFGVAKVVMKYLVSHANRSKNLAFLSPLFGSMHEVMELYPEEALECMGRIAFIPVKHRAYIIDNHTLALPPRPRLRFWEPRTKPLIKTNEPIMQFNFTGEKADSSNDGFTRPVFMASFDALWYYKDQQQTELKKDGFEAASNTATTTWWRTLYHMFRLKCHIKMPTVVECYDFNLEFFDNPAIAALVAYKCQLVGLFIVIIVVACIFLWLELLQAVHSWSRYSGSTYNGLDVVAFGLPLAASIIQLVSISKGNMDGNTSVMSASVLAVFMHMLFELRIHKQVCKYVMIIQQTVIEIRGFFIIFAGGLLAFTIATQHLLRACPVDDCNRDPTDFPRHFFYALSATYFFMGGRYDPVSPLFDKEDAGFHLMMIVYFFFTVIVMLNVLIALINVAFTKGDDGWRLAWIESRLRYIESAENMSHHIPGFRQTHDWFPKQIYFSATPQQARDYQEKYHPGGENMSGGDGEDDGDEVDPIFDNVPRPKEEEEQQQESEEEQTEEQTGEDEVAETAEGEGGNGDGEQGETKAEGEGEAEAEGEGQKEQEQTITATTGETATKDPKDKAIEHNSSLDLRTQVSELQRQLTMQQEQSQKQFDELKELLLRATTTKSKK